MKQSPSHANNWKCHKWDQHNTGRLRYKPTLIKSYRNWHKTVGMRGKKNQSMAIPSKWWNRQRKTNRSIINLEPFSLHSFMSKDINPHPQGHILLKPLNPPAATKPTISINTLIEYIIIIIWKRLTNCSSELSLVPVKIHSSGMVKDNYFQKPFFKKKNRKHLHPCIGDNRPKKKALK